MGARGPRSGDRFSARREEARLHARDAFPPRRPQPERRRLRDTPSGSAVCRPLQTSQAVGVLSPHPKGRRGGIGLGCARSGRAESCEAGGGQRPKCGASGSSRVLGKAPHRTTAPAPTPGPAWDRPVAPGRRPVRARPHRPAGTRRRRSSPAWTAGCPRRKAEEIRFDAATIARPSRPVASRALGGVGGGRAVHPRGHTGIEAGMGILPPPSPCMGKEGRGRG